MDGKSPDIEFGKLTPRQRLELDACTRCGECVRVCDSFKAAGEERAVVKGMIQGMRSLQRNGHGLARIFSRQDKRRAILERFIGGVYSCTLCGRCTRVCPVGIETRQLVFSLRENIVASHHVPANLAMVKDAIEEEHNVFKFPNQERATWIDFMEEPPDDILEKETAEV
ncbi:MAG: (Fe-S)-binding protein, partial [Chloroflexi bacterium]|nr:(Fe-S)-binding protein [Chloroflexota bacterium]